MNKMQDTGYIAVYTRTLESIGVPKEEYSKYIRYDCEGGIGVYDPWVLSEIAKKCRWDNLHFDLGLPMGASWDNGCNAFCNHAPILIDDYLINTLGLNITDLQHAFNHGFTKKTCSTGLLMEEIYGLPLTIFKPQTQKRIDIVKRMVSLFKNPFRQKLMDLSSEPYAKRRETVLEQIKILEFTLKELNKNPHIRSSHLMVLVYKFKSSLSK